VQGRVFDSDDYTQALAAEELLTSPPTGLPTEGDWIPLDRQAYSEYLQGVKQPTLGRLARESFSTGAAQLRQLAGSALQLAGAEELGGGIVERAERDIQKLAPFGREFTDIESGRDAVEWFVATLAGQGPMLLESIAAAGIGAIAGTAAGGPVLGTAGGAIAGVLGKKAFKEKVIQAAQNYRTAKAKGIAPDPDDVKTLRSASAITGALAANYGSSYVIGAGDIYGEMRDQGATAEDMGARMSALAGAVPYAALESLTEFAIAARIFGVGGRAALPAGTSLPRRGAELLRRGGTGLGVYGAAEGLTEIGQEAISMGLSGQDLTSDEAIKRFTNSFAAGFAVGGTIGGVVNLRSQSKEPVNLLDSAGTTEKTAPPISADAQMDLGLEGGMVSVGPSEFRPEFMPGGPGQGVLDIGVPGAPLTELEMLARQEGLGAVAPTQELTGQQLDLFAPAPQQQMQLDLSPPAPSGIGFTEQQPIPNTLMAQQMQAAQRQQHIEAAYQQQQAQLQAQQAQQQNLMLAQQQMQIAEEQRLAEQPQILATPTEPQPTQPVQLPLFTQRQAPVPSRGEGLRRGIPYAGLPEPIAPIVAPRMDLRRSAQVPLFTQTGEPSVAALRSAAQRVVVTPTVEPGATQRKPTGFRGKPLNAFQRRAATVFEDLQGVGTFAQLNPEQRQQWYDEFKKFEAEQQAAAQAAEQEATRKAKEAAEKKAKEKKDAVQKRSPKKVDVPKPPGSRQRIRERDAKRGEVTRKSEALKKGKVKEQAVKPDVPVVKAVETVEAAPTPIAAEKQPQKVTKPPPTTGRELLDSAIEILETTKDAYQYRMALAVLFDFAYFPDSNDRKAGLDTQAREFLSDLPKDPSFRSILARRVEEETSIDANRQSELFQQIVDSGLLRDLQMSVEFKNLPDEFKTGEVNGDPIKNPSVNDPSDNLPAVKLADTIKELNTRTSQMPENQQPKNIKKLADMYKEVRDKGLEDFEVHPDEPLSSYFDADGQPITYLINKKLRVGTEKLTAKQVKSLEASVLDDDVTEDYTSPLSLEDWNVKRFDEGDGRFFTDEGAPITKPVAVGKIRMVVGSFLSKLQVKPRVAIYKDQADLKARNPELYRSAKAARTEGDFDSSSGVGYSFGKQVIIFSDRVVTERQLRFVLAHETMGHFGMRSLMPAKEFDAFMNEIYDSSPAIQNAVDAAVDTRGLPKSEAVEEYLADFAANLDVSLIAKIWNKIKGALNKLGVRFGDEAARYFVDQSRRYVRDGTTGNFFDARKVGLRIAAIESGQDPDNVGRFSQATNLRADNLLAGLMHNNTDGAPSSITEAAKYFSDKGINTASKMDKFLANVFSLLTFRARENAGLSAVHDVVEEGRNLSMQMKVAMKEKLAPVLNRAITDAVGGMRFLGGITTTQLDTVNNLLYKGQSFAESKIKDYRTLGVTPLFTFNVDAGKLEPNKDEIERVYKEGLLTFEQAKNGFEYEVQFEKEGKTVTEKERFEGIKDLTKDDIRWQGYLRVREAVKDVELKLLETRYMTYVQDRELSFREIADFTVDKELTKDELQQLTKLFNKYKDIYTADKTYTENGDPVMNSASMDRANEYLVAMNKAIVLGQKRDYEGFREFFTGKAADDAVQFAEEFKKRLRIPDDDQSKFIIQNKVKEIILADISNTDGDLYTKHTLARGYTPYVRKGGYQTRIVAFDRNGNLVRLKTEYKEQLAYSQVETESEAINLAKKMNEELFNPDGKDKFYNVMAYSEATGNYELMDVKLTAVAETALDAIAAPPQLNLNEFIRGLRQFSIVLRPEKLNEVVVALTTQNAKARQRLRRANVPGAETDAVVAVSQHIESRASAIAKIAMRPKLNELMNRNFSRTNALWNGNRNLLKELETEWKKTEADPKATREQRTFAKREYDRYAYMYNKTNTKEGLNKANQYYNEAARLLAFLDNNKAIEESDFATGQTASAIRAYTSMFQLGGSFATGALNYIGAFTNGIPYLSTYNEKTAFGGGFGFGKSVSEFFVAMNQVGLRKALLNPEMNTAEFYDGMVERDGMSPAQKAAAKQQREKYGLKIHEAQFLAREIREGVMIPAQSNALLATARGRATKGYQQKAIDGWMSTFNYTEQGSRRSLGLASYRLAYNRAIGAGRTEKEASTYAREFAVDTLNSTVGEYSVVNRPPVWKTGIQSFLYMYKVFPTTSIQLFSRLPRKGQVMMLTGLWLLSGLQGFPLAEDLEDIIDTIAQKLGFKAGSIRFEIAKAIDSIAPGLSPYVLQGAVNSMFTGDMAVRTSLGDFVPGTGLLLSGSNKTRELEELGGPALSMLIGVADTFSNAAQAAFTEKKTLTDVLRGSPVTMARAFGDTLAYSDSGAIVDKRGYVVSPDLTGLTYATRLLGFYPQAASEQYSKIRVSKRIVDYQRETSAGFQQAYVRAKIAGDEARAEAILDAVNNWNEGAQDTPLFIRNFRVNANKALREARRPAVERLLRTTPVSARENLRTIDAIFSYSG
jgi:hypothetical protein